MKACLYGWMLLTLNPQTHSIQQSKLEEKTKYKGFQQWTEEIKWLKTVNETKKNETKQINEYEIFHIP